MNYVFPPREIPSIEIQGSTERFPVHRIYCVGRNYLEHIREGGFDEHKPPFFFCKPADMDTIVPSGGVFPYPSKSSNVHHEIELVVAIGKEGTDIAVDDALEHVFGYAVGIDMTRRDLQGVAKKMGRPWEVGKGFDYAAPCSKIAPASVIATRTRAESGSIETARPPRMET